MVVHRRVFVCVCMIADGETYGRTWFHRLGTMKAYGLVKIQQG